MVFSSNPSYFDSSNWQQQQQQQNYQGGSNTGMGAAHNFHPPPLPPPLPPLQLQSHGLGGVGSSSWGTGSIRPGSMADRARMANLPLPEIALKCPRCESTNTKFCYFNNYSLTQPRHFCKTCRRYWTRGGALRNVPVGGGCRRNKKSNKGGNSGGGGGVSNSKSSPVSSSTSGGAGGGGDASTDHIMIPSISHGSQLPPMRFMGSNLHNLSNHDHDHDRYGIINDDLGLNYSGITMPPPLGVSSRDFNFFLGNSSTSGSFLSEIEQQWKLQQSQQIPFFATDGLNISPPVATYGLDNSPSSAPYGLDNSPSSAPYGSMVRPKTVTSSELLKLNHDQVSSVKMELNNQDMSLSSRSLGMNIQANEQYNWTSAEMTAPAWTDLKGFSSSSTSHQL